VSIRDSTTIQVIEGEGDGRERRLAGQAVKAGRVDTEGMADRIRVGTAGRVEANLPISCWTL